MMAGVSSLRFSCSVCSEDYTESGEHIAKLLPCIHTVCGHCVENKLFQYFEGNLDCPVCGKEHHFCEGVKSIPENQYIKVIIRKGQGDVCKTHQKELTPVCLGCLKDDHKAHQIYSLKKSAENPPEISAVELESFKNTSRVKIEALGMENCQQSKTCKEQIESARERILKRLNEHCDKLVAEVNEGKIKVETRLNDAAEKVKNKFQDETTKSDVGRHQALKMEMTNLVAEFSWYKYFEFRATEVSDIDLCSICGLLIPKYFLPNICLQEITTTSDNHVNSTGSPTPEKSHRQTASTITCNKDGNTTDHPNKSHQETAFTTTGEKDADLTGSPARKRRRKQTFPTTTEEEDVNSLRCPTPKKSREETTCTTTSDSNVNSTLSPAPKTAYSAEITFEGLNINNNITMG